MSVYKREDRGNHWHYRRVVTLPDGTKQRIQGKAHKRLRFRPRDQHAGAAKGTTRMTSVPAVIGKKKGE